MGSVEEAEPAGDVATAMRLLELGREDSRRWEVEALIAGTDALELWRGLATLLRGWMGIFTNATELVEPIVSKARKQALISDESLPTVAGALTAAALGQSPSRWRLRLGPIDRPEIVDWIHAAWLLVDLVDTVNGEGTVARLTFQSLERQTEWPGGGQDP